MELADHTVSIVTGLVCLGTHGASVLIFRYLLPDGAWRKHPQFLAHQVVALPLMVVCAWIGTAVWFFPTAEQAAAAASVEGRVHEHTDTGDLLARIVIGAQLFWDSNASPSHQTPPPAGPCATPEVRLRCTQFPRRCWCPRSTAGS